MSFSSRRWLERIVKQKQIDGDAKGSYKSQNPNNEQIPMTKIVRASLGLPTLRAGPSFKIQNPNIILIRGRPEHVWVTENASVSTFPVPPGRDY